MVEMDSAGSILQQKVIGGGSLLSSGTPWINGNADLVWDGAKYTVYNSAAVTLGTYPQDTHQGDDLRYLVVPTKQMTPFALPPSRPLDAAIARITGRRVGAER